MIARIACSFAPLAIVTSALGLEEVDYDTLYESAANSFFDDNDYFEETLVDDPFTPGSQFLAGGRESLFAPNELCFFISGKLMTREYPGRHPDTYLFAFDKDMSVLDEDDNSSLLGNGKASAVSAHISDLFNNRMNLDDGATLRLGLTGRADGVDGEFDGLFFNDSHGQRGHALVIVEAHDDVGTSLGTVEYLEEFKSGSEASFINFPLEEFADAIGASIEDIDTLDVNIDNTVETFPVAIDRDFFEINGLTPSCDYVISVVGGVQSDCTPNCVILGWYTKNGELINPDPNNNGFKNVPESQLYVLADSNGRIRLAVSGFGDFNFDGLAGDDNPFEPAPRNIETPDVVLPNGHGCHSCYTLKVELVDHEPASEGGSEEAAAMLMLTNGDLNTDGGVDVIDLAILLNNWGWTAP